MIKKLFNKLLKIMSGSNGNSRERVSERPDRNSGRSWQEAAQRRGTGQVMYDGLQKEMAGPTGERINDLVLDSCQRLSATRTIPPKIIKHIHIESMNGRRAGAISEDVQAMLPYLSKNEIEVICRTVVSAASTALTRARSESLGLDWYMWKTSKDARVRSSHRIMQGVLVNWKEPPPPEYLNCEEPDGCYHAGERENCRCYPQPLMDLKDLTKKWPVRVYWGGRIQRVTKTQFKAIY